MKESYCNAKETREVREVPCRERRVADEIVSQLSALDEWARVVEDKVYNRLTPVMRDVYLKGCPDEEILSEYPPLFNTMRTMITSISSSLNTINDYIERTEI